MFERYTESARRTIFLSGYEARLAGSPAIESEHLLLAAIRASQSVADYLLNPDQIKHQAGNSEHPAPKDSIDDLRAAILAAAPKYGEPSTRQDIPISHESKRILTYGAEEANRIGHKSINPEHLLLGILREENCVAARFLKQHGSSLGKLRAVLGEQPAKQVHTNGDLYQTVPLAETVKAVVDRWPSPIPASPKENWLTRLRRRFGKSQ